MESAARPAPSRSRLQSWARSWLQWKPREEARKVEERNWCRGSLRGPEVGAGILPLQAYAQQASSSSSDRRGDAVAAANCLADSPGRLPAARDISLPPSGSGLGTKYPVLCACSSCPSVSPVRLLLSSDTKVTISARHQLLNLAHTWAGLV